MAEPARHDIDSDHVHKWLHREPEMGVVLRFVPRAQRESFVHWGVLLSELRETAFELSEPRVAAAKSAWWAEELVRTAGGNGRHPLSRGMAAGLDWVPVARALVELGDGAERASTAEQAWSGVASPARALARVEAAWFDTDAGADAIEASARALQVHLLGQRLVAGLGSGDGARIPMSLLARHACVTEDLVGESGMPVVAEWATVLLGRMPATLPRASLFRRLRAGLDREQLSHLQRRRPAPWRPGMASVLRAWRTALRTQ